ncbi:MAG: hypothetical protein DKT66_09240 [Candidatus Melainabacteria bacterium]|nr:MAG: hypothetical protein DKT66_09240 [Candidatus Melainabacteria bacterium]
MTLYLVQQFLSVEGPRNIKVPGESLEKLDIAAAIACFSLDVILISELSASIQSVRWPCVAGL